MQDKTWWKMRRTPISGSGKIVALRHTVVAVGLGVAIFTCNLVRWENETTNGTRSGGGRSVCFMEGAPAPSVLPCPERGMRRGVTGGSDVCAHSDYVDLRSSSVGFRITEFPSDLILP